MPFVDEQAAEGVGLLGVHRLEEAGLGLGVELGEEVGGVVGLHLLQHPGGPLRFHGLEDLGLVLLGQLLEDVGQVLVLHGFDQLVALVVGQVLHGPGRLRRVEAAQLDELGGRLADVEQLGHLLPRHPPHPGREAQCPAAAEHHLDHTEAAVERRAGPHRQVEDLLAVQRAVEQRREKQFARPPLEGMEVEGGTGEDDARRLEMSHPGGGDEDAAPPHLGHETKHDRRRLPGRRADDEVVDPTDRIAVGGDQRKLEDPGGVDRLGAAHRSSVGRLSPTRFVSGCGEDEGQRAGAADLATAPGHHRVVLSGRLVNPPSDVEVKLR